MQKSRRSWREELAIIDRTMKAISGVTDPEELVEVYWNGVGELIAIDDYVAVSRRNVPPPYYLITRSSRFTEHFNPWKERDRLPLMTGGLLGEILDRGEPVILEDLPTRLKKDDPAWFYLEGFQSLIALPQYDGGEALNVTILLLRPGIEMDHSLIPMLHWQGGLFGRGTQNLVLRNQLGAALDELDQELQAVGDIQRSLLPSSLPSIDGFDVAAHYAASARAGGDYYDFFPLPRGEWGLFIADVSGHGTPAAVLMAVTHAIAHSKPGTHTPPESLLAYLNDQLASAYTHEGAFVTAFYAVLNPQSRTLTYARAGHNPPRLASAGRVDSLDAIGSIPLGIAKGQVYEQATIRLQPGDLLLLYTDGVTEAMAPSKAMDVKNLFGLERLDRVLLQGADRTAAECIGQILSEVAAFTNDAPPIDDQTLLALRAT